ncbi:MAG: hypothetical protein JXA69_12485 [Phycisphaerae bacterium]|nr:hypothetical protein [Phycisphaerae bacterium]
MVAPERKRQPSGWTYLACGVAMPGLLAWGVGLHPSFWASAAFGMALFFFLHGIAWLCGLLVLLFSLIGMICKDALAFIVLIVTAGLAGLLFMLRDTSFDG